MRPEKTLIVADVREKLKASPYLLVVDYSGMKVPHFEELRTRLTGVGARLSVVRNTFLKIAAQDLKMPELEGSLAGQTAMVRYLRRRKNPQILSRRVPKAGGSWRGS